MNYFLKLLINTFSILIIGAILPGIAVSSFTTAFFVAFTLGVLHFFIKPILVLLTLPITIISFGLFLYIINAFLLIMAGYFIDGFVVNNLFWALLFGLFLSVLQSVFYPMLQSEDKA